MNQPNLLLRRAIFIALALTAAPLMAQEPESQGASARNLETIVVTAQKREQNLQDVPIVVTAVSEQLLQDTGVKDIKDLTLLTPGLIVTSTSRESSTTARIRGIGTVGDNPGLESSVGVVIDGVYRPRNGVGFGDLGELERIEVLKGPQGTLFGKNTSAGVINVVTKKPASDFGSQVQLSAGDYGLREGSASITGGLAETLAGRLYVGASERDGLIDVRTGAGPRTETEDFDRSYHTARGQLLLTPTEELEVRLTGDYAKREENCCAAPQIINGPTAAAVDALAADSGVSIPPNPFARVAYSNRSTAQDMKDVGASMEVNWDTGLATLTSITAWREWETVNGQDADFSTADILYRAPDGNFGDSFDQVSQELRLAGESDRVNWLVGAFYAREDLDSHNQLIYGNQFRAYFNILTANALAALPAAAYPANLGTLDRYQQDSDSWALFTNNSIRVTEALELTLGLRYTDESKELTSQYANEHGGVGCTILRSLPGIPAAAFNLACATFADPIYNNTSSEQQIDENEWSGTAKLAYRFSDAVMTYLSYAKGYKAGGFNLDRERNGTAVAATFDADTRFAPEFVDSYELGVKTSLADNTLLINGAVFYQDYEDFQLNTFTGIQFVVTSLPQVVSQGVDLDIVWFTPLEQLSLQGGVTYADTTIEDFGGTQPFFSSTRTEDRLSFAPEWSGSMSATFEQPIGAAMLMRFNLGAKYTSEYNTGSNLDPRKLQDSLVLVNARAGFGAEDERWMVEAWAQNLTDEEYYQVVFDATLQTGTLNAFLGAPRTYGLTARFKF